MKIERTQQSYKRDTTAVVLDILQDAVYAAGEIFDIATSGYGESYRKAKRFAYSQRSSPLVSWGDKHMEMQKLYSTLNRLKQQGFIEKTEHKRKQSFLWKITEKGRKKQKEKGRRKKLLEQYKNNEDDFLKIIIFDIPELESRKRVWLRDVLKELGFLMLQRSVWIGTRKIPEELIFEMQEKRLKDYIQIFEVGKHGTISDTFKIKT